MAGGRWLLMRELVVIRSHRGVERELKVQRGGWGAKVEGPLRGAAHWVGKGKGHE